jgi:hypothetical protein
LAYHITRRLQVQGADEEKLDVVEKRAESAAVFVWASIASLHSLSNGH